MILVECPSSLSTALCLTVHHTDARALFERAVNSFSPERARPIWERWARYEYQFGNLEAAQILEKRMSDAYPNG